MRVTWLRCSLRLEQGEGRLVQTFWGPNVATKKRILKRKHKFLESRACWFNAFHIVPPKHWARQANEYELQLQRSKALAVPRCTSGTRISPLHWLTARLPAPSVSLQLLSGQPASPPSRWTRETHPAHCSWVMCGSSFPLRLGHHLG